MKLKVTFEHIAFVITFYSSFAILYGLLTLLGKDININWSDPELWQFFGATVIVVLSFLLKGVDGEFDGIIQKS